MGEFVDQMFDLREKTVVNNFEMQIYEKSGKGCLGKNANFDSIFYKNYSVNFFLFLKNEIIFHFNLLLVTNDKKNRTNNRRRTNKIQEK